MAGTFRLLNVPVFADARGALGVVEEGQLAPFEIRRLFYLFDLAPGAVRGQHAHREQHQLLIMMSGACRVLVDTGRERQVVNLSGPREALHAPPMLWLELTDFSDGAVCAVLTSGRYDEADYIRDYSEFVQLI